MTTKDERSKREKKKIVFPWISQKKKILDNENLFLIFFFFSLQQGYFRTSNGSFFIEPLEDYVDEDKNILHILYKSPPADGESKSFDVTNSHGE